LRHQPQRVCNRQAYAFVANVNCESAGMRHGISVRLP
jgi:hypothetical protein